VDPEERAKLWKARHNAYFASINLKPGKSNLITDICVPISRLADCIRETKKDLDASGFFYTLFGHVGDGNFHVIILFDKENEQELKQVKELNHRLVLRGISMDGTATGEHVGTCVYLNNNK
jgi:D-lactate dehydrogenase (cytochrome)